MKTINMITQWQNQCQPTALRKTLQATESLIYY